MCSISLKQAEVEGENETFKTLLGKSFIIPMPRANPFINIVAGFRCLARAVVSNGDRAYGNTHGRLRVVSDSRNVMFTAERVFSLLVCKDSEKSFTLSLVFLVSASCHQVTN